MIKTGVTVQVPDQGYGAILLNVFKKSAIPVFKQESVMLAEKMVKELKLRIRKQLFNHRPLSPKYKARKIKYGYDARILIASKQYYNSITVIQTEYGAKVGVKDILHYPNLMQEDWKRSQKNMRRRKGSTPGTIPMLELAKILEFGATRPKIGYGGPRAGQPWYIPPRPHWRPVMSKFMREHNIIKKKFTDIMAKTIQEALAREMENSRTRDVRLK